MGKSFIEKKFRRFFMSCGAAFLTGLGLFPSAWPVAEAADTVCAQVKIEVKQELTLERQAFDAHMRINNGLSIISLEDIDIEMSLADEEGTPVPASSDPGNTAALFFIRLDSLENIDSVAGSGSIGPATSADIHWMIIPAPGSSNGLQQGKLYYVGAKLTYTIGGEVNVTEVTPDYIFVKPLPDLALDYFLPREVYGDDAFTPEVELPVPFSLGVRVKNIGNGTARNLKIDSAQPKIVENTQGLLIGFAINGSEVNGRAANNSLLVDFGNIDPATAATARWIMACTLSGQFISFDARVSHSDELGGELTSLIKQENTHTHTLVHDVLVDLPGRDTVRDFLVHDEDVCRIYETDSADTEVSDQSSASTLAFAGQDDSRLHYALTAPVTAGFMFAKLSDPNSGQKVIVEAVRSDGKTIKKENIWLSKTRNGQGWDHFINLFDVNTTGAYSVVLDDSMVLPQPPVIEFIPDRTGVESQGLAFTVAASDPNGTVPALAAEQLPAGAVLSDQGNGTAVFRWMPFVGQAGRYEVVFTATDGSLTASRRAALIINSVLDSDGDGLLDAWELEKFGSLSRDGSGDYDSDGISDLEEFQLGSDPVVGDHAPTVPAIHEPADGSEVAELQPQLVVVSSSDEDGDSLTYQFELYTDPGYSEPVVSKEGVPQGAETTSWTVPVELTENLRYYWRVRATDGYSFSLWGYGAFVVNSANEPPGSFLISQPCDVARVDTVRPLLEVTNSRDPDPGFLTYRFEVYADSGLTIPVASVGGIPAGASGTTAWRLKTDLTDDATYYWRAIASDELGVRSETAVGAFTVDLFHLSPSAPEIVAPQVGVEIVLTELELTVANVSHSAAVAYFFELDVTETFDSSLKMVSEAISPGAEGITAWPVAGLFDNTRYFWRVRVSDGPADSTWTLGNFFVSAVNETPLVPTVHNPGERAWVNSLTPELAVNPGLDPDGDSLTYRFEVYSDEALANLICQGVSTTGSWSVPVELVDNTHYFWRARAEDEHGALGDWTIASPFFVHSTGPDEAPRISVLSPAELVATNAASLLIQWEDSDPDSSARIALYYDNDAAGADGILIAENLAEDPDDAADSYSWDITAIEGIFYLYATITDEQNSTTVYGSVPVTIDRTPPEITLSPPGGSYPTARSVTLSTDEAAEIYYTLDGSEPTTAATLYGAPIQIGASTTLKCLAVDSAGNLGPVLSETYAIEPDRLAVNVGTDKGRVLPGVKVYVFTAAGSYTGKSGITDAAGTAGFNPADFAAGNFKFRVDYLSNRFWSAPFSLPDDLQTDVVIDEESAEVTVRFAGGEAEGVKVYLFTASGGYLGTYQITDQDGKVSFILPIGIAYSFRTDILGSQYWSLSNTIVAGGVNQLALDAGGGRYKITLREKAETPMPGVRLTLFNQAGSYLGLFRTTISDGTAEFKVPAGTYKVRADYLGYQFWSDDTAVTTDTTVAFEIPHRDVAVAVNGIYKGAVVPLEGLKAYLFTEAGAYQGLYKTTDISGRVNYHLPQKPYKVRADHLNRQYWSDAFVWDDPTLFAEPVIPIAMADADITVSGGGFPLADKPVYVYTNSGAYLGLNQTTTDDGQVHFRLPEGDYNFRADHQGSQYWSGNKQLVAHQVNPVDISTGGGSFTVTVSRGGGVPLSGVKCYVFGGQGTYLGFYGSTDASGRVAFDLADGSYRFRIDYLGDQFWSAAATVPDAPSIDLDIPHEAVEAVVQTGYGLPAGVRVYLFAESGAYLGSYRQTDAAGKVVFDLPVGRKYKFRADILNSSYWSGLAEITSGSVNTVPILAGGGRLRAVVREGNAKPLPGVPVYLYSTDGSYLGLTLLTDAAGVAFFDVPGGNYRLRADYLGYQFWQQDVAVASDTDTTLTIAHNPVEVTAMGLFQNTAQGLSGLKVFLFSPTDSYLGDSRTTDADGKVVFDLPQRDYKVRVDYLGSRYFSDLFNWQDMIVAIPMADAAITVTGGGFPQEGQMVYVYSETGAYLGLNQVTDSNGGVTFRLPAGSYNFRVDHQSSLFWSGLQVVETGCVNTIVISVGGGSFALTVEKSAGAPLAGTKCTVFNASETYLGLQGATNDLGQVFFDLAEGVVKFRVDHMGYQFWSEEYNTGTTSAGTLYLGQQDVTLTVEGLYLSTAPLEGLKVYLFTPAGAYLGQHAVTDGSGQVHFSLPDQDYQVRIDTLGNQFWSDVFQQAGTTMTIPQGQVIVRALRSGAALQGAKVYLFSESGVYLGWIESTAADGRAEFVLPSRTFKFRVNEGADQVWSDVVTVQAGASVEATVNLD
ncbi:MAG: chitobiase/beta-hexosaminidase C-terminal domain-containing protein [Desulfobacterales bacterium]